MRTCESASIGQAGKQAIKQARTRVSLGPSIRSTNQPTIHSPPKTRKERKGTTDRDGIHVHGGEREARRLQQAAAVRHVRGGRDVWGDAALWVGGCVGLGVGSVSGGTPIVLSILSPPFRREEQSSSSS